MSDEFSFEPLKNSKEKTNSANEPPIVASEYRVGQSRPQYPQQQLENPFQTLFDSLNSATSRTKAYGAPRVFDLFHAVSNHACVCIVVCIVGTYGSGSGCKCHRFDAVYQRLCDIDRSVFQMWLFGSNNPRLASLVAGPFALMIVVGLSGLRSSNWEVALVSTFCFSLVFGAFAGYLGGAVVAGVFLMADKFRSRYMPKNANQQDASFDDLN
ncbi:MAG: hypothetical protein U0930_25140 [Pirellulales bacterium]